MLKHEYVQIYVNELWPGKDNWVHIHVAIFQTIHIQKKNHTNHFELLLNWWSKHEAREYMPIYVGVVYQELRLHGLYSWASGLPP